MTIENLILNNLSLAEKIAKSRKKNLSHISYEELKSAAYLGLVEAANHYNPQENDCFEAYAVWRIIGAVRDYLRELAWGSRANPMKSSELFDEHYGKPGVEVLDSFDEMIKYLPTVNKTVLRLYYQEDMKIKDIAFDMGVHQSRVSQILSESRLNLRERIAA